MSQQSEAYSELHATNAGLTLASLGLSSWSVESVEPLQAKIGTDADGWFGPVSVAAWKKWAKQNQPTPVAPTKPGFFGSMPVFLPGCVILGKESHTPPAGLNVVNFIQPHNLAAQLDDTDKRTSPVTQLVFHLGAEGKMGLPNYAAATEFILNEKGLSSTFTMDADGTIYQHFDPTLRAGRHAPNHNHQSDSIDIGGPFTPKTKPLDGQVAISFKAAIGQKNDGMPPMQRKYSTVKCWSLTPAQRAALILFVPWYCKLRGIPLTACEDWRTFRVGGLGLKDPVTNVPGLLAHCQIAGPGERVDGIRELAELKAAGVPIKWRSGQDFFHT
ncbi:MAG: hypothetical protein A2Y38_06390 [Spirochaetes bacterium GWB1_59_5]|nr:MAG: hypothetical protein A2Y38_06390 [Spirochaetes bacterium GWB1_59_5]